MSWFRRHPNWTLIIVVFGYANLVMLPAFILAPSDSIYWFGSISYLVIILVTSAWNLRSKKRSLGHLLWLLLSWVGIIIILCLANKTGDRLTPEEAEYLNYKEEHK